MKIKTMFVNSEIVCIYICDCKWLQIKYEDKKKTKKKQPKKKNKKKKKKHLAHHWKSN